MTMTADHMPAHPAARPEVVHLTRWRARRSGAGITVTGLDHNGEERRFGGIVEIHSKLVTGRALTIAEGGGLRLYLRA